jgi:hypothetical protein
MSRLSLRRRPALVTALAVFVLGGVGLSLTQHTPALPLPAGKAIQVALRSPFAHRAFRQARWTRLNVTPVDSGLERVSFYDGDRIMAEVAVNRAGGVVQAVDFNRLRVPYGDWIAYEPGLLVILAALFVVMSGVAPWRRMRNLDVLAALSLLAPVLLLQQRYVAGSVMAALPGLLYLAARCARMALAGAPQAAPSQPLFELVTSGWESHRRIRLMRLLLAAMAVMFVLVTVSSIDAVDVVYAVMEGATRLLGGLLPYGHMPGDVIHGDTYPLLSYALYVPLAWLSPVQSVWDSVDLALGLAVVAALVIAWAVFRVAVASDHVGVGRMAPTRELAGLRCAVAWLAFPPVLVATSSGTSDLVLGAMLALAILLWRRPGVCTALLAAGAWFKLAPLALVPIRLAPLGSRGLVRAMTGLVLVSLPMLALLIALGGTGGPVAMVQAISFQFSRGSPQSVWSAMGISGLQGLGEGAVLALVAAAVVRLRRDPALAEDRQRMAALTAAVLIGLQLTANYWAFLYLVWVVPLVAMATLGERNDLAAREEPEVAAVPPEAQALGAPA